MLVGLNGQLNSGKDTIYERAKLKYPTAIRLSFADKLKDSVCALLGISRDVLEAMKNDPGSLVATSGAGWTRSSQTMREFLQRYGTEAHRNIFGQDFWVAQGLKEYDLWPTKNRGSIENHHFFVTDCRFPNEIEAIKARGDEIWRVHGPDDKDLTDHPSEQRIPDDMIDVEIDNTRRDDNFKSLDAIIELLLREKVSA
jgi:hypothetical protein